MVPYYVRQERFVYMNHMFSLFFMKATHRLYFFVINSFKCMYSGSGDFRLGCVLYFKCDSKYYFYFIQQNIVRLQDFYSDNPFDMCQSFALGRNMVIFQNKMYFHITNFLFYVFVLFSLQPSTVWPPDLVVDPCLGTSDLRECKCWILSRV